MLPLLKGTIQRAPRKLCMRVISVHTHYMLNEVGVFYVHTDQSDSSLDHDFTVRCIQVELIAHDCWMVPLILHIQYIHLSRKHLQILISG